METRRYRYKLIPKTKEAGGTDYQPHTTDEIEITVPIVKEV